MTRERHRSIIFAVTVGYVAFMTTMIDFRTLVPALAASFLHWATHLGV